jgi:hypothetical protein
MQCSFSASIFGPRWLTDRTVEVVGSIKLLLWRGNKIVSRIYIWVNRSKLVVFYTLSLTRSPDMYFYSILPTTSQLSGPGPGPRILLLPISTAWLFCVSSQGLALAPAYFYYLYLLPGSSASALRAWPWPLHTSTTYIYCLALRAWHVLLQHIAYNQAATNYPWHGALTCTSTAYCLQPGSN